MKRSPLKRTGSLKRSALKSNPAKSQLKSNKPLKSTKQLRPRSVKAQKLYKEKRIPLVKKLLAERPWCEACPKYAELDGITFYRVRPSRDLHEVLTRGRTGGINSEEWLDETNILCVCRECHTRIGDDPEEAEELGLMKRVVDNE